MSSKKRAHTVSLAPLSNGFYRLLREVTDIPARAADKSLTTWEPGLRITGMTRADRFLTSGERSDYYNGVRVENVSASDYKALAGWQVVDWSELQGIMFTVPETELVALGRPRPFSSEFGGWDNFALRAADCLPSRVAGSGSPRFYVKSEVFTAILSEERFPLRYAFLHGEDVGFQPAKPLSRELWKKLGYWIYTAEEETARHACKIVEAHAKHHIVLPFLCIDDVKAAGFAGPLKPIVATADSLAFGGIKIANPVKAARSWPTARHFARNGSVNDHYDLHEIGGKRIRLKEEDLDKLAPTIPHAYLYVDGFCSLPLSEVRTNGDSLVFGTLLRYFSRGEYGEDGPCVLAARALAEKALVSVKKASAKRIIAGDAKKFVAIIDGKEMPGLYVLASDAEGFKSRSETTKTRKERHRQLLQKYGDRLPDDWETYSDKDFAAVDKCEARRAQGWMNCSQVAALLGMENCAETSQRAIRSWLEDNHKTVCSRLHGNLYPPITREEIFSHPNFPALFNTLIGDPAPFAALCAFSESARAALVAGQFST